MAVFWNQLTHCSTISLNIFYIFSAFSCDLFRDKFKTKVFLLNSKQFLFNGDKGIIIKSEDPKVSFNKRVLNGYDINFDLEDQNKQVLENRLESREILPEVKIKNEARENNCAK